MYLKSLLIFLFVFVMAKSIGRAQNPIEILHINGTLYCTANGSPLANGSATPFPNAGLQVRCDGDGPAIQWNATTGSNGAYLVVMIPPPNATLDTITSDCRLFVQTPLANCNMSAAGFVSNLQFVRTITMGFARVTYLVASDFTLQP